MAAAPAPGEGWDDEDSSPWAWAQGSDDRISGRPEEPIRVVPRALPFLRAATRDVPIDDPERVARVDRLARRAEALGVTGDARGWTRDFVNRLEGLSIFDPQPGEEGAR